MITGLVVNEVKDSHGATKKKRITRARSQIYQKKSSLYQCFDVWPRPLLHVSNGLRRMYVIIRLYMAYTTTDRIPTDIGYVLEYTDGGSWPCFGFSYFTPTLTTGTTVVSLL
jgi:hypothetical protein